VHRVRAKKNCWKWNKKRDTGVQPSRKTLISEKRGKEECCEKQGHAERGRGGIDGVPIVNIKGKQFFLVSDLKRKKETENRGALRSGFKKTAGEEVQ